MSLVNSATTASFGTANDRIPGQNAAMVYLMTFCFSSRVKVLKCLPLPDAAAALEMPRLTKPQILFDVSSIRFYLMQATGRCSPLRC